MHESGNGVRGKKHTQKMITFDLRDHIEEENHDGEWGYELGELRPSQAFREKHNKR